MNTDTIKGMLKSHNQDHVSIYIAYLEKLLKEQKKDGQNWIPKNPWLKHKTDEYLATIFKNVSLDGLVFDGDDITLQNTGVSYSYQAFKNKMLNAYPESIIDVNLVYKDDSFTFNKESGSVKYVHEIGNPFARDDGGIIGAYCVIKNKRGEFLTLLSRGDIDKHRQVAKTDYIWKSWFAEMSMKTIIKKACKQHFKDIYQNIETIDNENYDLDNLVSEEDREKEDTEKFHATMKWYAVHEPQAYKKILNDKWQLKSARQITKPTAREGIKREIEEATRTTTHHKPEKKFCLSDTPEWKDWEDTKESCQAVVKGWPVPVDQKQCIQAVEQAKAIVNNQ